MNKLGCLQTIPLIDMNLRNGDREDYLKYIKDEMYRSAGMKLSEKIPITETEIDGNLELRLNCYVFTLEQLQTYRNQVINEFIQIENKFKPPA